MTMTGEQQRSQARHQRILDAALEVFARRGYRDSAVDDIAAASGTSKGGVYFHFPNKSAIFDALLRRTARLLLDRTEAAISVAPDPIAKVDAALLTVLRLFAEHPTMARLFLVEALGAGSDFTRSLMTVHDDFAELISRHLDEAIRAGAIAPLDTKVAGVAWFGALNEIITRWALTGQPERLEDAYPALRALLLRGVGAPVGGYSYGGGYVVTAAPVLAPDRLRSHLREAARRAREHGADVLVSVSARLPWQDPLELFAQASGIAVERFYWERHADVFSIAAAGIARDFTDLDALTTTRAWQDLVDGAILDYAAGIELEGPLLLGGISFEGASADRLETPNGSPWDDFPAGRMFLPSLALATSLTSSVLTVNAVVGPRTDIDAEAIRLLQWCEAIFPLRPLEDKPPPAGVTLDDLMSRREWESRVNYAIRTCQDGDLAKVVMARAVRARASTPLDATTTLARLRAAYPNAFVFALSLGDSCFLGASPERLVKLRDGRVEVACLAGSAPRGDAPEEDSYLGNALLASAKDRAEHDVVVRGVRLALEDLCTELSNPISPQLLRLSNVQHLYTPVEARARAGVGVLELVASLHPTPAVGGFPKEAALRFINAHEGLNRGWYGGAIGWVDRRGMGEFAVALRSAVVREKEATMFAGCGIVAASNPSDEYAETCLKLDAMLDAIGAVPGQAVAAGSRP